MSYDIKGTIVKIGDTLNANIPNDMVTFTGEN